MEVERRSGRVHGDVQVAQMAQAQTGWRGSMDGEICTNDF